MLPKVPINYQGLCTGRFRTGHTPWVPILARLLNYVQLPLKPEHAWKYYKVYFLFVLSLSLSLFLKLFLLRRMFSKFHVRSPRKRMRLQSPYHSSIWVTPLPWSCRQQPPSKHWHLCTRLHRVTATSQKTAMLNFEAFCCFQWELGSHDDSLNVNLLSPYQYNGNSWALWRILFFFN